MSEPIVTQRCSHCKQVKALSEFHKDNARPNGTRIICKLCVSQWANTDEHRLIARLAKRRYRQTENGKKAWRRYYNTQKNQAYRASYRKSEKNKVAHRRSEEKNANKVTVRQKLNSAIRYGKFPRASTHKCKRCGKPAQEYHHWLGYAPEHTFDVLPYCYGCHKIVDREGGPVSQPTSTFVQVS